MENKIAGRRAVVEALKSNRAVSRLLIRDLDSPVLQTIIGIAQKKGVPVERVTLRELDRLVQSHQGIIALVEPRGYVEPEDMLESAQRLNEPPLLVLLDGVQDPQNLGAIIRTCDACGAHGLVLPKKRSAGLSVGAIKASAGSSEHLAIAKVVNLARTIEDLKTRGIWVIGTEPKASTSLWEADLTVPIGLVMGGEHSGLSRNIREKCDYTMSIPMKGHVGSLNVSASAAVVLCEVMRQRRQAALDS